jgi:hypothetical protein
MTPVEEPTVVAVVLSRSTHTVQGVRSQFAAAGFTVGPASGPTFTIEAPIARFKDSFGATPVPADDGGWTTDQGDEFPLDGLPDALRQEVTAVALERPAEMHGFDVPHDPGHGAAQ